MASLVILGVVLIPLNVRTDTGHRNSEIYQAMQIGVLQYQLLISSELFLTRNDFSKSFYAPHRL